MAFRQHVYRTIFTFSGVIGGIIAYVRTMRKSVFRKKTIFGYLPHHSRNNPLAFCANQESEEADLAGIRKSAKCSGILQHLHMGFGYLGAGSSHLLDG